MASFLPLRMLFRLLLLLPVLFSFVTHIRLSYTTLSNRVIGADIVSWFLWTLLSSMILSITYILSWLHHQCVCSPSRNEIVNSYSDGSAPSTTWHKIEKTKDAHRSGRRDWLSQWTLSLDRVLPLTQEAAPKFRRSTKVHCVEDLITRHWITSF